MKRVHALIVKALQRHIVVQVLLVHIIMENEPGCPERPLLSNVDPTGQMIPIEVNLECFK